MVAVCIICVVFVQFYVFEVHYFMRMGLCVILAKFFKKRLSILDTASFTSICLTTDVDMLLYHMNNARYLREVDFARVDFYERTKLFDTIRKKGGEVFQGATTIRYRRFIRPFTFYKITTRIIYWTESAVYMEHRFLTADNFVRTIVLGQQKVVNCNLEEIIAELVTKKGGSENAIQKPECPLDLRKWIECNEISSVNLRNGC